jgi:hypothetical protein
VGDLTSRSHPRLLLQLAYSVSGILTNLTRFITSHRAIVDHITSVPVLRACCKFLQAHLSAAVAIVLLLLPYAHLKLPRAHLVLPVSHFLLARVDPSSKYRESTLRLTTTESNSMSSETPIALATRGPKEPQDFGTPLMLEDFIPILEPTTIVNPCAVCHTPDAESRCSRCKNIRYSIGVDVTAWSASAIST